MFAGNYEPVWTIDEGVDYPRLVWENKPGELITVPSDLYGGGTGEPEDPYLIYTAQQLNTIGFNSCHFDKHFKLMVDLGGFTGTSFNIIGIDDSNPFSGVFDGNGHTILNFTYTSPGTSYTGLFGYVDDPNAEIKNLGLINANINAGTGTYVGSLVGGVSGGTITNCYAEGGSVSGNKIVGGLVGGTIEGTITNSYSTASVSGGGSVGGLVGSSSATITNCYSTGGVSGYDHVGGLVGYNSSGIITYCSSTGSVAGGYEVGGLVGIIYKGTITNCYSTASVSGEGYVGGLVGENGWDGTITNCYSTGSVSGEGYVGGLVGENGWYGTITNCYATGSVTGHLYVGGFVGYSSSSGHVVTSYWDIETSGQERSNGGTGLTTAEMQTMSTFTEAGWDFVGESVNGTEDIWWILKGDYPHLWWEGIQVSMKLTPRTLNCRSQGNWVKAHLTLPQGFTVADVDSDRPAVLHSFGFQSAPLYVFVNKDKLVEIEAAFERQAVCSLAGEWPQALTVAGFLTDGNIFLGNSTVRIIHPGMNVIEELAWYWLNADCVQPDFCNEIDMNRDSLVNLADYALLMNIEVEFVTDE